MALRLFAVCLVAAVVTSTGCVTKLGQHLAGRGCGCGVGCGSEVTCGCEPSCCAEPSCGCGSTCGVDGRSFAGQCYKGCGTCEGPKWCPCVGPDGGCGCEATCAVEPGCGCEPTCGCEPSCGCETSCGCGSTCGPRGCFTPVRSAVRFVLSPLFGCNGCGGELYWSEWHNDPPQCCDPCDRCGNWIGPSSQLGGGSGCNCGGGYGDVGYTAGGFTQSPGHQAHEQYIASQPTATKTK